MLHRWNRFRTESTASPRRGRRSLAEPPTRHWPSNWNDFLHYTKIGRFDLAKGYAKAVLQGNPDPAELFKLVEENQQGYAAGDEGRRDRPR